MVHESTKQTIKVCGCNEILDFTTSLSIGEMSALKSGDKKKAFFWVFYLKVNLHDGEVLDGAYSLLDYGIVSCKPHKNIYARR